MEYTRLNVSEEGAIGTIELAVPDEYNRMPPAFWDEFPRAVRSMDDSGSIRAIVIQSQGKHFSSGLDVSTFAISSRGEQPADAGRRGEIAIRNLQRMQGTFTCMERSRVPILTAVQGACVGGGVDLVSASDIRYCTTDAFFCIQEINIGLAADVGTLQRLPGLIPNGLMRELAFTGRRLYADEAKKIGLVNQVFASQDEMLETVHGIAATIASKSPLAIAATKHLLDYGRSHSVQETLDYQAVYMSAIPQGTEIANYFTAKQKGETPIFANLSSKQE